eukprot:CAMPEP_0170495648 /NCGR_PEP_ID=MMETSP0208-20121228/17908_1 /TAXON_ID=197538 /ORGANISM="Strombidium inclinatum, Strain S3" /LENGTH=35 /DNA_ID= /DNA_START= /DNA_END= /DNA_ORIENTATION=
MRNPFEAYYQLTPEEKRLRAKERRRAKKGFVPTMP